jgi:hypothetical protein
MVEHLVARFPNMEITGPLTYVVGGPENAVGVSLDDVPVRLTP